VFNIIDDVDTYRIVERSLGFRWFFVYILLTQFRTYRKGNNNAFFLFDEPASNLHPSAQMELLKSFEKLPKVIYTTHSHYLINPKWLESTYVVKNEAIDYENEHEYIAKNTNIQIRKYREFAVKHPRQTSYFQPILEVLDYRPANLELVPNVLITEGKNDFFVLNYIQEVILKNKNKIKIVPGTSSSNLETLISLYLGWGAKFCVLFDSDKEGKKQKKRYIDVFGKSIENLLFTYEDINQSWDNYEIENFFNEDELKLIQIGCFPLETNYKKTTFNRSIQELFINSQKVDLSAETITDLKNNIEFISKKIK
jgi:predicted ATP-dependent endonuclease of OLD family